MISYCLVVQLLYVGSRLSQRLVRQRCLVGFVLRLKKSAYERITQSQEVVVKLTYSEVVPAFNA